MQQATDHISVMARETLEYMAPRDGEVYVDGTFGAGGHSRALLEAAQCKVFAIDQDPLVEIYVSTLSEEFSNRFEFINGRFGDMDSLLNARGVESVDGVLLDIGVSSMQLDTPRRGFSFSLDGPLDMRMSGSGRDASHFVNSANEEELAGILFKYGGERQSRRIAKAIVAARSSKPITRTGQLAEIIRGAVKVYNDNINPATRTFQALRIWVNNELEEFSKSLDAAEKLLSSGGRLVTITFHSGEDSIVKQFLNDRSGKGYGVSRHWPLPAQDAPAPTFELLTRKAVTPDEGEIRENPRARSAKLRAAIRTVH